MSLDARRRTRRRARALTERSAHARRDRRRSLGFCMRCHLQKEEKQTEEKEVNSDLTKTIYLRYYVKITRIILEKETNTISQYFKSCYNQSTKFWRRHVHYVQNIIAQF